MFSTDLPPSYLKHLFRYCDKPKDNFEGDSVKSSKLKDVKDSIVVETFNSLISFVPTLLFQSEQDEYMPSDEARQSHKDLFSPLVTKYILLHGNHNLSNSMDLPLFLQEIQHFIHLVVRPSSSVETP
jgi:hypothetical protein